MHPLLQKMIRVSRRLVDVWRRHGGFAGSARKTLSIVREHGLRATVKKCLSLARGGSRFPLMYDTGADLPRRSGMLRLPPIPVAKYTPTGTVCVHLHLFYPELAEEFRTHFAMIPCRYTLLISVVSPEGEAVARKVFGTLSRCDRLVVKQVENRGRDMGPFFCAFGEEVSAHDYVAHFHTKKSPHMGGMGNLWRGYLLRSLLGTSESIAAILQRLENEPNLALVYAQTFNLIPCMGHHWLANRAVCEKLLARLGYPPPPNIMFDYAVGSMFWARTKALRPLLDLGFTLDDFDPEAGQLDGTLAHALERLMGYVPTLNGYHHLVLNMEENPQRHRWGTDQCHDLAGNLRYLIESQKAKITLFNIFNTLLISPLERPDQLRDLVAQHLSPEDAAIFLRWRDVAAERAREQAGAEVTMPQIAAALADVAGIDPERATAICRTEITVMQRAMTANAPLCEAVCMARKLDTRVIYVADTPLQRDVVEEMLRTCGVPEPDRIYLSSECNLRKDDGSLYRHILREEKVDMVEAVMAGDDLRTDIQIPSDMGIRCCPILRADDLLRSSPAFASFIAEPFAELDDMLAAGLVLRDVRQRAKPLDVLGAFGPFLDFQGLGYAILGPVLTGFAAWIARESTARGIEKVCFLARDGKIMRQAYDAWREHTGDGPPSVYLEVSRRAVSVPCMESLDDLLALLAVPYLGRSCRILFKERTGFDISEADEARLRAEKRWPDLSVLGHATPPTEIPLLRLLAEEYWPQIRQQAGEEREALLHYFDRVGLCDASTIAFADVGYSATIQNYAARLLDRPLTGFYLMTGTMMEEGRMPSRDALGFIGEQCTHREPHMRISFRMERLLSASEGQVVCHRDQPDGVHTVVRRPFSCDEYIYGTARRQLREGLDRYIRDALALRDTLCPAFAPTRRVASAAWMLMQDLDVLDHHLKLDDFYHSGGII